MGASSVSQLISLGTAQNAYNNSGIKNEPQWIAFFNEALRDLVDDLRIEKVSTINFIAGTREYNLASGFYAMNVLTDSNGMPIVKRRNYNQQYPSGYWLFNRGSGYVIDLYQYTSSQTFTYTYQAYPTEVTAVGHTPEVPSVGEKALVYYALSKALRNNNQIGIAQDYERLYEEERKKIRNAVARGVA